MSNLACRKVLSNNILTTQYKQLSGGIINPKLHLCGILRIGDNNIRIAIIGDVSKSIPMLIGERNISIAVG